MRYDDYRYLWPPRPENSVPPALINFYHRRGWCGQVKKNGTCTVIFARGDEVIFKTRHNDDHKAWTPLPAHVQFFSGRKNWNVYVAELLHSKGPHLKNHLYLFDVLVSDGEELLGHTFASRWELMRERFQTPAADISGSRAGIGARFLTPEISHAELITDPVGTWNQFGDWDEGLVFKNPYAALLPCISETSNGAWQVKIRRPHSNYSF